MQIVSIFLCVAGTVLAYTLVRSLYLRYKHPLPATMLISGCL